MSWKNLWGRVAQPSTVKGVAYLCGAAGYAVNPDQLGAVLTGVVAVVGIVDTLRDEAKSSQ